MRPTRPTGVDPEVGRDPGASRSAPPRHQVLRATTAALLRDTLVTAPLLVAVLFVTFGLVLGVWADDVDQCCVASASGFFIGIYQFVAAVSVTALLLPHVAAGGRRADFSAALLVKHVLVTGFFVLLLAAAAAVDGSAQEDGLLAWTSSWAAGLAALAATGTLVGTALRRWGRAAWFLLPITTSPLWWSWTHGGLVAHQAPGSLAQVAAAAVLAALASHLVIRTTPLP